MQLVLRQLINFGHNLVVVIVVLIIFPPQLSFVQLLLIPGFILLIGNLLWMTMVFGMLGARFRDIEPLIGAFMPLMFFLSPVIYRPDHLGMHAVLAWINPFSYLISLIRDPIQGVIPHMFVYGVSSVIMVTGWLFTLNFLERKYRRVSFWV
jgi:ABC-type polysaccharide/polyol phosphate export permease